MRRAFLLIFLGLSAAAFLQVAGAQTSAESPGNGFGNTSGAQNVNITVEQISGVTAPSSVGFTIDPGDLNETQTKTRSGSSDGLIVTTNSPDSRSVDAFVSNYSAVEDGAADIELGVEVTESGDATSTGKKTIYDSDNDDGDVGRKEILSDIDGVHQESYGLEFSVEVGPDHDPSNDPTIKIEYTLTSN